MTEEQNLGSLMWACLRKSWLILLLSLLSTVLTITAARFLVTPQYESTVTVYVEKTQSTRDLADSFEVIVKMRESLMEIIRETGLQDNHNDLRKRIRVESVNNTDFFTVTVSGPEPYETEHIADAIGRILPEQVARIMKGTTVNVVGEAVVASEPSIPNYPNTAALGFLLGMLLSAGGIVLKEMLKHPPIH